jgi:predicted nuclease with TOPRIM domain
MDYSKLTKQELLEKLEVLQCEDCGDLKLNLKDAEYKIKDLEKSNEEIRKNEYEFRAEASRTIQTNNEQIGVLSTENTELKSQLKFMEDKFKELAALFEEYVKAFKDQNALLGVFNRNTQYIEQHLDAKIKKFNNEGE